MLNSDENKLFDLIRSDVAARNIFFSKVENPKFFFDLKAEGYFDPSSVPEPIEVTESGYQFPYWAPISYLQKLSAKIKQGECFDLIDEILLIVEKVSTQIDIGKSNNKRLYFFFIDILNDIPNDHISITYLKYILPIWLKVGDAFYTSPEIIERLIPKFLRQDASKDDKEKSELLLRAVLNADLYLDRVRNNAATGQRYSRDLYWLNQVIVKRESYKIIGEQLDNTIVFYIADQLKIAIWNLFPLNKYEFVYAEKTCFFELIPKAEQELQVQLDIESEIGFSILKFDKFNDDELLEVIIKQVPQYDLSNEELGDFKNKLRNAIRFGVSGDLSVFRSKSFFDEDDEIFYDVEGAFAIYLQKISESVAESNPERGTIIIRAFISNEYRSVIFKRLAIYLIARNWHYFGGIFWELVESEFGSRLFAEHYLASETYHLINKNALHFSDAEIERLQIMIDSIQGPDKTQEQKDFSRLRWISALREHPNYQQEYKELSHKLSVTHNYFEESNKVQIRVGDESPFNAEEIMKMGFSKLLDAIRDFKSDTWMGPSARGFSNSIEQAVTDQPEEFTEELERFNDAPYVYVYGILSGFLAAWKNKKTFNWSKLLTFCANYISTEKFISGRLVVDDGNWGFKADWIDGIISNLITEGTQSDNHAFEIHLMPLAEKILSDIIVRQSTTDMERIESSNMDYPMFAINTTQGKVYRALLDCALRNRRNENSDAWLTTEKPLFVSGLAKGVLEIDIYIGWHLRQFYFLDKDWTEQYLANLSPARLEAWKAFMGGLLFPNPPNDIETYKKVLPHYRIAIEMKFVPKNIGEFNSGLTRHVACAYFWSFDDGALIKHFIDLASPAQLGDLIHFFRTQQEYINELSMEERNGFRQRVIEIWTYLLQNIQLRNDETFYSVGAEAADIIIYFDELTPEIHQLMQQSFSFQDVKHEGYFIQEHLVRILTKNNTSQNAKGAANIFLEILSSFIPMHDQKNIKFLVDAIYQHAEVKILADRICDIYLKEGVEFLRDIRARYNP